MDVFEKSKLRYVITIWILSLIIGLVLINYISQLEQLYLKDKIVAEYIVNIIWILLIIILIFKRDSKKIKSIIDIKKNEFKAYCTQLLAFIRNIYWICFISNT